MLEIFDAIARLRKLMDVIKRADIELTINYANKTYRFQWLDFTNLNSDLQSNHSNAIVALDNLAIAVFKNYV